MASLNNKTPAETFKDLLTVNSGTDNQGLESSLKTVSDGEGVESAIQLSTTTLKIPTGKTLEIAGTLNSVNATLTGDLSVGDDLTVSDLISGNSMSITTHIASSTLTTTGQTNVDSLKVGGGFGYTGLTVNTNGVVQTNGAIETDGRLSCSDIRVGGGFTGSLSSPTGLNIDSNGRIDTDEIIVCQAVKTTQGTISSSASNSPKVKLDNATKVALTVDDGGNDKEILKVEEDGEATIKDKAGDTKFVVKDTGVLKYKEKTTAELTAIKNAGNAVAGDIAYDSVKGFVVYVP